MPLDLKKLEKRVDLADGMIRARCPACAEKGQDKTGEHLRIFPDGRFGCCVFPKDREHRRRIFALAGERSRQGIKVRVAAAKSAGPIQTGILGHLGRLFSIPAAESPVRDARDGVNEIETRFPEIQPSGTPGTPPSESKHESVWDGCHPRGENGDSGTLGTPLLHSYACSEEGTVQYTHKDIRGGVPSVPERETGQDPSEAAGKQGRMPYLTPGGTLGIPFDAPERYHWWMPDGERMHVAEIIAELHGVKGDG